MTRDNGDENEQVTGKRRERSRGKMGKGRLGGDRMESRNGRLGKKDDCRVDEGPISLAETGSGSS